MSANDDKSAKLAKAFEDLLRAVGRSPGTYPELLQTPVRAAAMWLDDLLDGYEWDPADILAGGSQAAADGGMVVVRDVFFHSTCPHHLLPYHGLANIAYVPRERIIGFSKINRLVDCFAHRLEVQETITRQVADALVSHLGARGAAVVLESEQTCMTVRGVKRRGARILTTHFAGVFGTDADLRHDFLRLIEKVE